MQISNSQERALNAVEDLIKGQTSELFSHNIMILIYGIRNVELKKDLTAIPINPDNGNDRIQINIPNWVKSVPTPPFTPGDYQPPQVWYNNEPEPIQTIAQPDVRYVTETSCTGDKNGIVHTTNTNDVQYNGDFRDEQTSFNDK